MKTETTSDVIAKRNKRLESFFRDTLKLPVRIIGDENKPAVVYNDEILLSCHVHNFELNLSDKPFDGKVVCKIKLLEQPEYDSGVVNNWIQNMQHSRVFKISLKVSEPKLYIVGYNYLDRVNKVGKFPVFGATRPHIYFEESKAKSVVHTLTQEGYELVIEN